MTGQAAVESFEPEKCDVDGFERAFCPYKDAKEAWEAYRMKDRISASNVD